MIRQLFLHINYKSGFLWTIAVALFLLLSPLSANKVYAGSFTPEQVKAAMLIKFTDFINWPEKAFKESPENFVIGVLGSPELFALLTPLEGKKIQDRFLRVIQLEKWDPKDSVHLVYLDHYPEINPEQVINQNDPFPTLTVSDSKNFLKAGGILQFITLKNGKIGFAVNRNAQLRSDLDFSASLLKLADIKEFEQRGEK